MLGAAERPECDGGVLHEHPLRIFPEGRKRKERPLLSALCMQLTGLPFDDFCYFDFFLAIGSTASHGFSSSRVGGCGAEPSVPTFCSCWLLSQWAEGP